MKKTTKLFFLIALIFALVNVSNAQNTECEGTLTESGSEFTYKFETTGTDVTVTFEMVTPRTGLVAYAHTYNPNFAEVGMTNASGQKFTKTFTDQAVGSTFKMACKFAWAAGGLLETSTLSYTVGSTCTSNEEDNEIPTDFTAEKGAVSASSVELLLNATDNSGSVIYTISYGSEPTIVTKSGTSGTQKSIVIGNLEPGTEYTFSIVAKDAAGNEAANNPQTITATTSSMEAAPTPTAEAANVISLFSNAYTNVPVTAWKTTWSVAGPLTDMQIAGDDTKKYDGVNFVGIETTGENLIDASGMLYFNVDILTDNITSLKIKLVDFGANGVYNGVGQVDDKEAELTFTPSLTGWNTYHIPLSDFTTLVTRAHIAQYIFTATPTGTSSFYLDNMYFSNDGTSSVDQVSDKGNVVCYPNQVSDKMRISAKSQIDEIVICNLLGQAIRNLKVNALEASINLSEVTAGNYFVNVKLANGQFTTQKFIKL